MRKPAAIIGIVLMAALIGLLIGYAHANYEEYLRRPYLEETQWRSTDNAYLFRIAVWRYRTLALEDANGRELDRIHLKAPVSRVVWSTDNRHVLIRAEQTESDYQICSVYRYAVATHKLVCLSENADPTDQTYEANPYIMIGEKGKRRNRPGYQGSSSSFAEASFLAKSDFQTALTLTGSIRGMNPQTGTDRHAYLDDTIDEYGGKVWRRLRVVDVRTKRIWNIASDRRDIPFIWAGNYGIAYVTGSKYRHLSIHLFDFRTGRDAILARDLSVPKITLTRFDAARNTLFYGIPRREIRVLSYRPEDTWFVSPGHEPQIQRTPVPPGVPPGILSGVPGAMPGMPAIVPAPGPMKGVVK